MIMASPGVSGAMRAAIWQCLSLPVPQFEHRTGVNIRQSAFGCLAGKPDMRPTAETHGESRMSNLEYAAYEPAAPYFNLVRRALGALVDGEHFFDIVADDVVYEVLYELPGWPRVIKGRTDLMAAFRGYVENIALQSADKLIAHKTDDDHVIIEYEVHGTILATGVTYNNRFCSIINVKNRKITGWRDYMDSLAAWNALRSPPR